MFQQERELPYVRRPLRQGHHRRVSAPFGKAESRTASPASLAAHDLLHPRQRVRERTSSRTSRRSFAASPRPGRYTRTTTGTTPRHLPGGHGGRERPRALHVDASRLRRRVDPGAGRSSASGRGGACSSSSSTASATGAGSSRSSGTFNSSCSVSAALRGDRAARRKGSRGRRRCCRSRVCRAEPRASSSCISTRSRGGSSRSTHGIPLIERAYRFRADISVFLDDRPHRDDVAGLIEVHGQERVVAACGTRCRSGARPERRAPRTGWPPQPRPPCPAAEPAAGRQRHRCDRAHQPGLGAAGEKDKMRSASEVAAGYFPTWSTTWPGGRRGRDTAGLPALLARADPAPNDTVFNNNAAAVVLCTGGRGRRVARIMISRAGS